MQSSVTDAIDGLFRGADEIDVFELFFEAPFDETDLDEFRTGLVTGLRNLGISEEDFIR